MLSGAALLSAGPGTEPRYEVAVEQDVVYRTVMGYWDEAPDSLGGRMALMFHRRGDLKPLELKLDIYYPKEDTREARPLLFMLHGGSYFIGHKDEPGQREWCRYFASMGYVAVSADYRMGFYTDKADITRAEQDAVEDAAAALTFLTERDGLRLDLDHVYLAGTSAGAAIALQIAYGNLVPACHIRAVANLWGYVHDLDLLEHAAIPILSFQSERDPVVPYREGYPMGLRLYTEKAYGTLAVHNRAIELGIPAEHHPCKEKAHKLHLDHKGHFTPRFDEIRDAMASFFCDK